MYMFHPCFLLPCTKKETNHLVIRTQAQWACIFSDDHLRFVSGIARENTWPSENTFESCVESAFRQVLSIAIPMPGFPLEIISPLYTINLNVACYALVCFRFFLQVAYHIFTTSKNYQLYRACNDKKRGSGLCLEGQCHVPRVTGAQCNQFDKLCVITEKLFLKNMRVAAFMATGLYEHMQQDF